MFYVDGLLIPVGIRDWQLWSSTRHFILLPVQSSLENQLKLIESKRIFESNYIRQQRGKSFLWKWGLARWWLHRLQKQRTLSKGWRFHSWQMWWLQLRKRHKKAIETLLYLTISLKVNELVSLVKHSPSKSDYCEIIYIWAAQTFLSEITYRLPWWSMERDRYPWRAVFIHLTCIRYTDEWP